MNFSSADALTLIGWIKFLAIEKYKSIFEESDGKVVSWIIHVQYITWYHDN